MKMEMVPPDRLSRELRLADTGEMKRRRAGILLSFAGSAIGALVGAYQTGLLKRLPDILPGRIWDAEKVDASDYAYRHFQSPDGLQMLVNYGVTATLIAAGGADRARENPALPIAAAAKAAFDLALTLALSRIEWRENRALCSWCHLAIGLSGATLALALPEARRAMRAVGD